MDYLLSALTIISFVMIGRKNYWGFVLSAFDSILWIVYALLIRQYGLIPASVFLLFVNGWNAWKWYRESLHLPVWGPAVRHE